MKEELTQDAMKLPLLISVPHGGYSVPLDIVHRIALDFSDIFRDSDPCTRSIYSFRDEVCYYHDSDIARAIIDLNRAPDDLPPENPDGVVKSHTVMETPVYRQGHRPDSRLIRDLLERYYYPYHQQIAEDMADPALVCGLDCHSMLEYPPGTDAGENERPFICLSNCGDENGSGEDLDISCPADLINLFADCLRSEFPEEADRIVLNNPFKGGHISQLHGRQIPWIQIELNRSAYLSRPWFDSESLQVKGKRLQYLRHKLFQAILSFCEEAGSMRYLPNQPRLQYHLRHFAPSLL